MMMTAVKPVGLIKARPEDFVVREVKDGRVSQPEFITTIHDSTSPFTAFKLTKRNTEAEVAYAEVAKQLGVQPDKVSSSGRKDKVAVTAQTIVVEGSYRPQFKHADMWLTQIGPVDAPLWSGAHSANQFTISVKTDVVNPPNGSVCLNLYGPQRLGIGDVDVGRHLLEGEFDQALDLLSVSPSWRALKKIMERHVPKKNGRDFYFAKTWSEIKPLLEGGVWAEEILEHPDFSRRLSFEVLKWQSHLWNCLALKIKTTERWLPMWSLESSELYSHLWNPVSVDNGMYELCHTHSRKLRLEAGRHVVSEYDEGFVHEFSLPSGAYATVFLASLYTLIDDSKGKSASVD